MNHKRDLITDGPTLSIQACDDGVWLHFTTLDGKRHCSFNLPVKFAKGTYLYDELICQWAKEFAIKNTPQNAGSPPCLHTFISEPRLSDGLCECLSCRQWV